MKRNDIRLHLAAVVTCLMFTVHNMPSNADEKGVSSDINAIEKIKSGATNVEIQLKSSRPFPVRAIPPELHIGSETFSRSFRPEDGDLNSLIFLLPAKDFAQLRVGEPMRVVYGRGESPREQWDFGAFVK